MKFEFNKRYALISFYAFLVLAGTVLFFGLLYNLDYFQGMLYTITGLLTPFIYAFSLAYLLNPVLKVIEQKIVARLFGARVSGRLIRAVSLVLTYLFMIAVLGVFVMIIVPQLVSSITGLLVVTSKYVNSIDTWLPSLLALLPEFDLNNTIEEALKQYTNALLTTGYNMLKQFLPWILSFSTRFASGLLAIIVGVIVSIYMLMDKELFCAGAKKIWYALLPREKADWLLELTSDANRIFGGFISGKILDSLIIGIICFFMMSLMKMPSAMLISVIVGVTNVIPYFGPFIGAIPSFFIILIDDPMKSLLFLLFILVLQQFDGNILGPKILGDSTGLSAFWVIFSIMLFGGLYGFIGMFLGVPVFSVFYMLIRRFVDAKLSKRGMPQDIESYCAPESPLPSKRVRASAHSGRKFRISDAHAHTVKPLEKEEDK